MIRKVALSLAVFALVAGTGVAAAIELEKRIETTLAAPASIETVEAAVDGGLIDKGWTIEGKTPGRTVASIRVREEHFARIAVTYDTRAFAINLISTEGLLQNDKRGTIHGAYGRWSGNAIAGINNRLRRSAPPPPSVYAPQAVVEPQAAPAPALVPTPASPPAAPPPG
ncbi:MAG: hypothetical protein SGJ23_09770 [Alphaproteobacteria bacterium]|nr:hypothetical protein [Alphaproteobacteria bacterium]